MNFKDEQFLTVEHISPHMEKTSEGYLLCRDVPISRVGEFEYSGLEVGIPSKGGRVLMTRTADELFRPETIQSFNAKPVVIGHARFADPENWKDITVGIVQNVRRGQGDQADELLADLLLTDRKGIDLVESGRLREVSCGYDASPVADGDGKGHQVGIVGNHVALVEKARCGRACKIRDSEMKTTNLKTFLRRLFRDGDEEKFNEALDQVKIEELKDEEGEEVITPPTDPTSPDDDRLAVLEHEYKEMAQKIQIIMEKLEGKKEEQTDEDKEPAPEEVVSEEETKQVLADAETVCPGMKRPQGDSADGKFTRNLLERIMRTALKDGGITQFGDAATLDGQALEIALKASAQAIRDKKNPKPAEKFGDGFHSRLEQINELNKKFWSK